MMNIIVTGSGGQLGTALKKLALQNGDIGWVFLTKNEFDITNKQGVNEFFGRIGQKSFFVINCAAYTDVERAEDEPEKAYLINFTGAENLAAASAEFGFRLIHISTDFVFDGKKNSPYSESDQADPLSVYGKSKLEGDKAVLKMRQNCIVIRTSWLYSATHKTFLNKILEKAGQVPELRVVSDEKGSPTFCADLASGLIDLIRRLNGSGNFKSDIYNFCNTGSVSRSEYAGKILQYSNSSSKVIPISSNELKMKAVRPKNSSLDNSKVIRDFGLSIRNWEDALNEAVREIHEK
jgi:dTDP-4-dehydrorhamnose reductase